MKSITKTRPIRRVKKNKLKHIRHDGSPGGNYNRFSLVDGSHDFREAVPEGFVDYGARKRHGGKVRYFNFALAKDMGLIPRSHPEVLNERLCKKILDTFAIQIINEYDIINKTPIPKKDILPGKFMATRYLQLQHPDKNGTTSGDGRSIWNGQISNAGQTWDISSCGTGATRLSPATAQEGRYFKTGDPKVCYGCGYSDIQDGLSGALMSEIFYKNGVKTERTLTVIEFPKNFSINVRAGHNLLRPSHFFNHLKQENYVGLKGAFDYFISRQTSNLNWKKFPSDAKKYQFVTEEIAKVFAKITAQFESEYLFVWLDWDGDNILTDGSIIDYGSVRQFGLYHHEYRYDDSDRWSTTIPEQKLKARYIVQTFAQIRDYLITGKKKNRDKFKKDKILSIFDSEFEDNLLKNLIHKIGLDKEQGDYLYQHQRKLVERFKKVFTYFEKAKSSRGKYGVSDGITWDAIYCMRDILRELPISILNSKRLLSPAAFMKIIASSYANSLDRALTPRKITKIKEFQKVYKLLIEKVASRFKLGPDKVLLQVTMRSSVINRYDRITGDSILHVTNQIMKERNALQQNESLKIMLDFISHQRLRPGTTREQVRKLNELENKKSQKVVRNIMKLVRTHRESL